jgi:hypothetical protein
MSQEVSLQKGGDELASYFFISSLYKKLTVKISKSVYRGIQIILTMNYKLDKGAHSQTKG